MFGWDDAVTVLGLLNPLSTNPIMLPVADEFLEGVWTFEGLVL